MKKLIKISVHTAFLIIGIVVAFQFSNFLSEQIMDLYKWSSNGNISFTGKFISFWAFSPVYLLSFGFSFLLFSLEITSQKIPNLAKNLFLQFSIFIVMVVFISSFDAIRRIISCVECSGNLSIHFSRVNYVLILSFSVICSSIPTLVRMIRNKYKTDILK